MAELTRFRLIRNPEEECPDAFHLHALSEREQPGFISELLEVAGPFADRGEEYVELLSEVVARAEDEGGFTTGAYDGGALASMIEDLVAWLRCHPATDEARLRAFLVSLLDHHGLGGVAPDDVFEALIQARDWGLVIGLLEDRLLFLLADASVRALRAELPVVATELAGAIDLAVTRLRAARLVQDSASGTVVPTDDVLQQYLTAAVVLPDPPFPLVPTPKLAGPPVLADLYVVRDEWARYVAGELAFIENVMPGELRERATRTMNRTEVVEESETIDVTRTRNETYESERTTEAEESSKQTSLEVGLQFQNDLTVRYGPVENNTQIGASLAFSRTEAERRANEIARESGRRAITETERRIRQLRRVTTETTVRQLDAHRLENDTGTAVRGVYRWVERIQRYQMFRYPHRLQLEFYLPEPGQFLRLLLDGRRAAGPPTTVPQPLYLTNNGEQNGNPITLEDIQRDTYEAFGAALGVTDLPAPPAATLVMTESLSLSAGTRDKEKDVWQLLPFPPVASGTKEVQIPEGYQALAWGASAAAAPELAEWRDWTDYDIDNDEGKDGIDNKKGYHSIVAAITVASTNVLIRNRVLVGNPAEQEFNTVHVGAADYRTRWLAENATWQVNGNPEVKTPLADPVVGKLSFGATLGGTYNGTVSVTLHCVPTDEAFATWQMRVFDALSNAVLARQRQIENAAAAGRVEAAEIVKTSLSRSVRAELIRDELKRQVLECLMGDYFHGFDDAPTDIDPNAVERPFQQFDQALLHALFVRFFEQSFEWSNLMHVLYPSYWARSDNWKRRVAFDLTDHELMAFLDAGGARVLVPARPGFEHAVFTFLESGLVLSGGIALSGSGKPSLSVADEIMSLTRPPEDGEAGESWESTVPTALLWLDTELALPITNNASTLTEPDNP